MKRLTFDRTLADRVEDFDCGDAPYAREVSDFVSGKTGEVWQAIDSLGLSAWLYQTDADDDVIGFTSLIVQEVRLDGASPPSSWIRLDGASQHITAAAAAVALATGTSIRLDGASHPLAQLLMIAYFGIQAKFHKKPGDDFRQFYARQIFRDLIAEARIHPSGLKKLGLYVNPLNAGAIRLYSDPEFGFRIVGTFDGDDCMVADL